MNYDDLLSNYIFSKRKKDTKTELNRIIKNIIEEINEDDRENKRDHHICPDCYISAITNEIDNFVIKIIENDDDIFDDEVEDDYIYRKYLDGNLKLDSDINDFPYESCICDM